MVDRAGVVLAAGAGTRLRPLTDLRPKALCPVGGRPLLEHALDRLADALPGAAGPPQEHLAVNAHAHADQVAAFVARGHDGPRAHLALEAPEALGTAGALGALREWLDGRDVVLTNADAWLPAGLDGLLDGWDGERCRLLVAPAGPPDAPGAATTGTGGDPLRPAGEEGPAVRYVGACALPWRLVRDLAPRPSGLFEVLWRAERDAGRLELHATDQAAVDCGTPRRYLAANLAASGGRSVVGAGARVEGELVRSVVWDGAVVDAGEVLVDCVRAGGPDHRLTVGSGA
ncbi:sugar phosphate nucleotidyltransferase [Pseudokineococcus marinus]|uniref:NTP transferase domain-containing protein n=1 Tax=Pseudokineococcus marinus TaxID=351215 RepID=A0A849BKK1_9ACTN|nr:sugar phosphate nucleotidyltransferase [Pseudokineococcus marinus]NNH23141.1 NTP transferase domain-containing protein [Pseudokineococcus marinus]